METIDIINHVKTKQEHEYTSTGIKFWRHRNSLESYVNGTGRTIISTHISPEGSCNLKCPYCSVSKRVKSNRIEMDTIKKYVCDLKERGLKAVILTGGGEPTLYPHFNELVRWLHNEALSVALITNGTNIDRVDSDVWKIFSWVRISLNFFEGYQGKIMFPDIEGVLGASMVYTGQTLQQLKELSDFVPKDKVSYIRVLPDCLNDQDKLIEEHRKIAEILDKLDDSRFFQQFKLHGFPCSAKCHQAYFRPYLSEVGGGTVFPCDSLVLNDEQMHFSSKYAICKAAEILDFMDGKIELGFDATMLCSGCVFTDNIKLLDEWVNNGKNRFSEFKETIMHEDFI